MNDCVVNPTPRKQESYCKTMTTVRQPAVRQISIGAANMQYLLYDGDQPTLVMLHATGFQPWLWHPIASQLSGKHQVIAPYFCDYRKGDAQKGALEWILLAEDFSKLCEQLDIGRPLLIGHSLGATVATYAQAIFGLQASGMILIEPIFLPEAYYRMEIALEEHPLASKTLRRRTHWNNATEMKAYLKSKPLFANWEEAFLDLYIEHGTSGKDGDNGLELLCPPAYEAALFMGDRSCDPGPLLPKIECPVMVVEGTQSGNREFIDLAAIANRFPNGCLQRIEGAGHLVPMEKSKETLKVISDFTRSLNA